MSASPTRLSGTRALVTGAASGIGRATAELFSREGADMMLVDVDGETLGRLEASLGDGVHAYRADIGEPELALGAAAEAERVLGGVDVLVNNAGVSSKRPFLETDETEWDRVLRVNLDAAFLIARRVADGMVGRGSGCILNVSSISGRGGGPSQSVYGITKGALLGLTREMALRLDRLGVRVNAVLPGVIDTPMARRDIAADGDLGSGLAAWIAEAVPIGRIGTPEEVAEVLLFLASADGAGVSGCLFPVEGGFLSA